MNRQFTFSTRKYKLYFITVILAFLTGFSTNTYGQACDTSFIRQFGDPGIAERAFSILSTPEGNLLIGGSKGSSALLMMTTPTGELLWERNFEVGSGNEFIYEMTLDSEGKLVMVGRDQFIAGTYCFVMRYDYVTHELLWSKKMTSPNNMLFNGIKELPNGNFIVVGSAPVASGLDNLVFEVNKSTGVATWNKAFNNGTTDFFTDIIIRNGACYASSVQRYGGLDKIRATVSKLDLDGTPLWTKNYIRSQANSARTYTTSIDEVNDTLVVFGHGNLSGSGTNYSFQLFTTDISGNPIWAKNYQLSGSDHAAGKVVPVPNGYVVYGSYTKSFKTELFVMKVDRQGQPQWAKAIGSPQNEIGRSIILSNDDLYFVGYGDEFDDLNDIFLARMTLDGGIFGSGCSYVKDVLVTVNDLPTPFSGSAAMSNVSPNLTLADNLVDPIIVVSSTIDLPGCGCQASGTCNNVMGNTDFENGLAGWSVSGNVSTSSDAHTGSSAGIICGSAPGSVGQIYPAVEGEVFNASLWAKTFNPPTNAFAQLRFLDASFVPLSAGSDQQFFFSSDYELYHLNSVAPAGTAYVHFLVWKQGSECTIFDDVQVCNQGLPPGQPDLTVSNLKVHNEIYTVQQGTPIPIGFTIKNNGAGPSTGYSVKIYLSSTPIFTQSGLLLSSLTQQNLSDGDSINLSTTPIFPSTTPPGNYYIIVKVDEENSVTESDETNNIGVLAQAFPALASGNCAFVANVQQVWCSDNGTSLLSSDDLTNFKLSVSNTAQSVGYHVVVQQTNESYDYSYGVPYTFSNIPISLGNLNLTLTEISNPSCSTSITVTAPATCSNGQPDLVVTAFNAPSVVNVNSSYSYSFTIANIGTGSAYGQSGQNHPVYISVDDQYDASDVLVGSYSFPFSFPPNSSQAYGGQHFNTVNIQPGNYYLLMYVDKGQIFNESNENNNIYAQPITVEALPPSNGIDLFLSISSNGYAPIYTSTPVVLQVTNQSNMEATGVKISCPLPAGVIYTGGNEYVASQGSFGPLTGNEWNVGTLVPGAMATLTLNYFMMQSTFPVVYAQVIAANEPDIDSTPNNGTPPTPNEDDEASSAATSFKPDLNIGDLTAPTSIQLTGGSFTFKLKNIGSKIVSGTYQVGTYLSVDNLLSPDDYTISISNETNTGFGSFDRTGLIDLPAGFAPGNYYLIIKADIGNVINEINENNNVASSQIALVITTTCTGDVILTNQAEVDAFQGCTVINGDLVIQPVQGATNSDITDLSPLLSVTQVNGGLIIAANRDLPNLHGLENITSATRLVVTLCDNLENLNELSSLQSELEDIFIMTNPALLNLNGLEGIQATNGYFIISDNNALLNIDALSNIDVAGKVQINNNASINNIQGLANLASVQSDFIISNCDALQNLNGLQNLTSVGGGFFISSNDLLQDVSAASALTSVGDFSIGNNPMLSDCCIFTDLLNSNAIGGNIYINNNLPNCNSVQDILDNCAPVGNFIDLELSLVQTNATPSQWTSYTTTATLTNNGDITATGVKVHFPKPIGVVYTGGNEATASQGSFDVFGSETWNVGSLAPGGNATLTVSYFLLQSTTPVAYAQLAGANETDTDSTPNNGTPPTPNEDDEASSTGAPPPPPPAQPDLTLSGLTAPTSISPGLGNFTFTFKNIGTTGVQGSYQIGSFLSTDNVLSADDYAFATIPEQNTAVGSFARTGQYDLPTGFAPGNYFLIVKVDVGNAIAEGNENNNVISSPVSVTGIVCSGDMILTSQAEVDAFPGCNIIEGSLIIRSPNGMNGASSNITDLSPLMSLTSVSGILLENNDLLVDLHGLDNIAQLGYLVIWGCETLDNLQALSGISGTLESFVLIDNAMLANIDALTGISTINQTLSITNNPSLTNINGLSNINSVGGSFEINGNISLTDIQGLSALTEIGGEVIIANNTELTDLNGLENLTSIGLGFVLAANISLVDVSALDNLASVGSNLYVALNHNLSDCCVFNHLLTSNAIGGTITIEDNAVNCNSSAEIITNCTPQGIDLELTMTATNPSPNIYTSFPVKLTITNSGGQAATGVEVSFPRPAGVVYEGGNEFTTTKGAFNAFGNERWYIGNLAAGESATLTVRYFLLTNNALHPFAQVVACNETDADSQPNNGTSPTPAEDDEATTTINGFAGGGSNSLVMKDNRHRLAFDRIYPNPAKYVVTLDVHSYQEQSGILDFYNQQGQLVQTMEVELEKGRNVFEVIVSDWKSGTYNIIVRGTESALPAYGRFLKIWEE